MTIVLILYTQGVTIESLKQRISMKNISDLQLGKAGEYLVCADLILNGYVAFPSEQGLSYDVVADVKGKLIRIQVKTTACYRATPQRKEYLPTYLFHSRRCGKGGRKAYDNSDLDIMAFVCLQDKVIGYFPINEIKTTMIFRVKKYSEMYKAKNSQGKYLEDYSIERSLMQ